MVDKKYNIKTMMLPGMLPVAGAALIYSIVREKAEKMTTEETIPHILFKVELGIEKKLDGALAEKIGEALEELGVSVFLHNREATDGDDWTVTLTTLGEPDLDAICTQANSVEADLVRREQVTAERLPETDWLQHVHDNFPPIEIGRFFVYGSHYEGEKPDNLVPLHIDAATAFGSGEHETTRSCMEAFEQLARQHSFGNALDMGCGSGILAIAIQKTWPEVKLTAVDIDPESIVVTKRHAGFNDVQLEAADGDGYHTPLAQQNAPYDLVACNILSGPLVEMSGDLFKVLKPGGFAVLSGLLRRQREEVTGAHLRAGLTLAGVIEDGDWAALIMQRKEN